MYFMTESFAECLICYDSCDLLTDLAPKCYF